MAHHFPSVLSWNKNNIETRLDLDCNCGCDYDDMVTHRSYDENNLIKIISTILLSIYRYKEIIILK